MNLFTRNSPYYQLLKYLLFLLKNPVCIEGATNGKTHTNISKEFLLIYHHYAGNTVDI
jgi:hypothetical protein